MTSIDLRYLMASRSREALLRMADAGNSAVQCMADLHLSGSNLVVEVLKQHGEFTTWEHYPPQDVRDPTSHSQYYFHAHPPEDRHEPDYGHFHTFLRSEGMPLGVSPLQVRDHLASAHNDDHVCHLIAISMNRAGLPEQLFTTNRWVTGETWYKAQDVTAMLDRFTIGISYPSPPLNQWLTAMLVLFRPQIEQLLVARDRVIDVWQIMHPDQNVFEDRQLEVTSAIDISLHAQLEVLDQVLEAQSTAVEPLIAS